MTRSLDLVSNRLQQDYLLSLRAGLQHLGESLESMVSQDSTCWPDEAARTAFNTAVSQLNRLVNAGRVNSGYCPFTGKQQTTIGGSEVGSLLRKLAKIRPVAIQHGGQETKKLGRAIGKLLREDGTGYMRLHAATYSFIRRCLESFEGARNRQRPRSSRSNPRELGDEDGDVRGPC
eukprot:s1805_g4.t3